jgi:hydrocephalus-inducing protein
VTEREKFVLPLRAVGPRGALTFPDAVTFPAAVAKGRAERVIVVRNVGARASEFELRPPAGFAARPSRGVVVPGAALPVTLAAEPLAAGPLTGEMEVVFPSDGLSAFIALAGEGVDAPVYLSTGGVDFPPT